MDDMYISLYLNYLVKTFYDFFGFVSLDECLNYNSNYSDADCFRRIFEKLINSIEDISYYFEGIDDIDDEIKQTPFYDDFNQYDVRWAYLYFIPLQSIKTSRFTVEVGFGEVLNRFFTSSQLKMTVAEKGIYVGMDEELGLGNYLSYLQFIINILKEER